MSEFGQCDPNSVGPLIGINQCQKLMLSEAAGYSRKAKWPLAARSWPAALAGPMRTRDVRISLELLPTVGPSGPRPPGRTYSLQISGTAHFFHCEGREIKSHGYHRKRRPTRGNSRIFRKANRIGWPAIGRHNTGLHHVLHGHVTVTCRRLASTQEVTVTP